MNLPPDVYPRLLSAGRRDWPSGVTGVDPWTGKRLLTVPEIWVVMRGKMTIIIDGEPNLVTGGHIIWFEPNREYEIIQDPDNPISTNFLRMRFVDDAGNPAKLENIPAGMIQSVDINLAEAICRRITELMWEAYHDARELGEDIESENHIPKPYFTNESELTRSSPFCPLLININAPSDQESHSAMRAAKSLFLGLISEIQYQLARQKRVIVSGLERHHRQLIATIALQMQQDPKNAPSVSDIASRAGYSTDHFTRTFRKIMGCSPQQFLLNARLAKAKAMLQESGLTIKEIADQLGYCNAYFFSRQFKTMTDQSPSEYRKAVSSQGESGAQGAA